MAQRANIWKPGKHEAGMDMMISHRENPKDLQFSPDSKQAGNYFGDAEKPDADDKAQK